MTEWMYYDQSDGIRCLFGWAYECWVSQILISGIIGVQIHFARCMLLSKHQPLRLEQQLLNSVSLLFFFVIELARLKLILLVEILSIGVFVSHASVVHDEAVEVERHFLALIVDHDGTLSATVFQLIRLKRGLLQGARLAEALRLVIYVLTEFCNLRDFKHLARINAVVTFDGHHLISQAVLIQRLLLIFIRLRHLLFYNRLCHLMCLPSRFTHRHG